MQKQIIKRVMAGRIQIASEEDKAACFRKEITAEVDAIALGRQSVYKV